MPVNKIRRNGSYAPLSAHYYKDDAIDEAGEAAELLYVRGLAFCADVLSDGFISDRQLVRFVGVGMFDAAERAARLVEVELWQRVDGGYMVRSWLNWNRSRADITDYQAKDAARKRGADSDRPDPEPPGGGSEPSERNPRGVRTESANVSERSPNGIQPRARTPLHSTPRNSTPPTPPADADLFDQFWAAYPRRIEKRAAEKAWRAAVKRGVNPTAIVQAASAYARQKQGTEARFVKHPASWLNAGGYDDEPEQPTLSLVQAAPSSFEDYRTRGDARAAARLIRAPWIEPAQPPSDNTPARQWLHDRAVEWIDEHEQEIRAALTERKTG